MTFDPLVDIHRKRNLDSRDRWEHFAPHRDRVTKLLIDQVSGRASLGILGAGNCNDLDLARLLAHYESVTLIDLDMESLEAGVARQQLHGHTALHLCGDKDVTGILRELGKFARSPSDDAVESCLRGAREPVPLGAGPFDVVASACLLTQLIDTVHRALGENHARFLELTMAVRNRHLQLLLELSRPGGVAVLINDFVSSDTCPELLSIALDEVPQLMARAIMEGNFFTGANPIAIHAFLRTDPTCGPLIERLEPTRPWLWNLGPRVYAVCALVAHRSSNSREGN